MNEAVESFPLYWPDGHPRTPSNRRVWGQFTATLDQARRDLQHEVRLLGGQHLVISTNMPVRRDGELHASAREPSDPGVAIYFDWDGQPRAMACDRYDKVWKNVRALAHCIDSLRSLDRHGSSAILERAFRGFAALPAIASPASWSNLLGVPTDATPEEVDAAYRAKAKEMHPDKGGTDAQMADLNAAREAAKKASGDV